MTDQTDAYRRAIDVYLKAIDEHFRKGNAYNNTVVAIGYGSFFALWSFMSDKIAPFVADFVAVALALSAFCFFAWEVCRMVAEAWVTREVRLRKHADEIEEMNQVSEAIARHERRMATPYFMAFTFSVVTGFVGGAVLIGALIIRMLFHQLLILPCALALSSALIGASIFHARAYPQLVSKNHLHFDAECSIYVPSVAVPLWIASLPAREFASRI